MHAPRRQKLPNETTQRTQDPLAELAVGAVGSLTGARGRGPGGRGNQAAMAVVGLGAELLGVDLPGPRGPGARGRGGAGGSPGGRGAEARGPGGPTMPSGPAMGGPGGPGGEGDGEEVDVGGRAQARVRDGGAPADAPGDGGAPRGAPGGGAPGGGASGGSGGGASGGGASGGGASGGGAGAPPTGTPARTYGRHTDRVPTGEITTGPATTGPAPSGPGAMTGGPGTAGPRGTGGPGARGEGGRGEGGRGEGGRTFRGERRGEGPRGGGRGGERGGERGRGGRGGPAGRGGAGGRGGPGARGGGGGRGGPGARGGGGMGGGGARGRGEGAPRVFGQARDRAQSQSMGAQDAPALGGKLNAPEPATLRDSVQAVQPRREELVDAVISGYDATRARAEMAGILGGLGAAAEQQKAGVRDRATQQKAVLQARAANEIAAARAAAADAAAAIRGSFADARSAAQAAAEATIGDIDAALATDLASIDSRTRTAVEGLQTELGTRVDDILAYGAQKDAEPAQIVEQEAQRAEREGRAAAAEARRKGAAMSRTFGGAEPGPDQARAVMEIAEPTAADMEAKAVDLASRTRSGAREVGGKHAEYAAKVAESVRGAGPALQAALQQQGESTKATLQSGAEQAKAGIQAALEERLGALSQMEEGAVAQTDAGAAEAETRMTGAADAASASLDEAAGAAQAELDGVLTETQGAFAGMEAPNPAGVAGVASAAEEAMAAIVNGAGGSLETVAQTGGDALGEASAQVGAQMAQLSGRASGDAQRTAEQARNGFRQTAQRRQQAATSLIDGMGTSQAETVQKGLAEVDGAIAKAKGEMDARNNELRTSIAQSVNEGLGELRQPLGGLDGRMQSAATAVMEEFNKPWYKKVLSGLWNAVVGIVKGLVVLVVVALVVAAVAAAFGVALTAFGAMMIAGAILLAGGFIMACMARSEQLPDAGFGEIGLIALQDTLGITGIREAWTGEDMVTGQHLDLEQRTERGTLGVVNIVMMAAGARAGFRTTPWTRPAGYPTGMAGVRALGGDLVTGSKEGASALVDRVLGRRSSTPEGGTGGANERVGGNERSGGGENVREQAPVEQAVESGNGNRGGANERVVEQTTPERPAVEKPSVEEAVVETPKTEPAKVEAPKTEPATNEPAGPQRSGDLDVLYREAADAQVELADATRSIASETNGRALVPENLKGRARASQKVEAEYGGDASRVTDLARSSVEYESFADLQKGLDAFRNQFEIVRVKNRFETPTDGGYRDVLINLRTKNGHVVEVQLHLKQILEVKNGPGHALYEQIRDIQAKAATEGRALTPEELAQIERLNTESRGLYNEAMDRASAPSTAPAELVPGDHVSFNGEAGWKVVSSRPGGELVIANETTGAVRRVSPGEVTRAGAETVRTSGDAGAEIKAQSPQGGAEQVDTNYVNRGGNQRLHVDPKSDPALVRASERAMARVNRGSNLQERVSNLVDHVANDVRYDQAAQEGMYRPTAEMPRGEARLGEMLEAGAVVCREKAVFTHKMLAEMGIESRVVTGNVKVNGPQGQGSYGHAWVELSDGTVVDGTWGRVYPGGRGYPVDTVIKSQTFFRPRQNLDPAAVSQAMDQAAQTLGDPRALDALRARDGSANAQATPAQAILRPGQEIVLPESRGGILGWLGRKARGRVTRVERDMVFVEKADGTEVMYPRADILKANGFSE